MLIILPFIFFCYVNCDADGTVYYDSYHGTPITGKELSEHIKQNTTFWCINAIKPCKANEGRRYDGSCNNPRYPSRGASHTPFYRLLPAAYERDFDVRKTCSGNKLPLARLLSTRLLTQGQVPSQVFTQLTTHILLLLMSDLLSIHDTVNYVRWRRHCCMPKGKSDPMCAPNEVPLLDPVLRYSDVRCMPMTRPITFQNSGCLPNNTVPERIVSSTPSLDLSLIYGSSNTDILKSRLFKGGLLKYDLLNGRVWPPTMDPARASQTCTLNESPHETRCHNTPVPETTNNLISHIICTVWVWRLHNYIANQLAIINPYWTDEKLFSTAREINIAMWMQIYIYELLSHLMGRKNLIRSGVIVPTQGFRDINDKSLYPQTSLEFPFVMRWVHTFQSDFVDLHDSKGYYLKRISAINTTIRTGFIAIDNNLEYITHGSFRKGCGKIDYTVDPDIANRGFGPLFKAYDIMAADVAKGREYGLQPYIKYREYCSGRRYRKFEDLAYDINPENIEILKDVFESVNDIDLMAGIWMEKLVAGGYVPPTWYCIVVEQLLRTIRSDRHWYERPTRPNAFTLPQLLEIRKSTMALILCLVGDNVSSIQPHAFLRPNPRNRIRSCRHIKKINFAAWKDTSCPYFSSAFMF